MSLDGVIIRSNDKTFLYRKNTEIFQISALNWCLFIDNIFINTCFNNTCSELAYAEKQLQCKVSIYYLEQNPG